MKTSRKAKKILPIAGLLLALAVHPSGCAGGGGCGVSTWPTGAPAEVTYLLPKFECAQAPTSARCCPATSGSLFAAEGCCKAHGDIMDARKTAVKSAHSEYSNEQVLNAILGPFTPEENSAYITGCCSSLAEPNKACCTGVMSGGDRSACADIAPSESSAKIVCWADPENMAHYKGKEVIIAIDPHGQPTKITCGMTTPSGDASTAASTSSELAALMTSAGAAGGSIDWSQTKGDVTVIPEGGLVTASSALTGTTLVMKSSAAAGALPGTTMNFSAPALATGADVKASPSHDFSFAAIVNNATGQPAFTAIGDVPTIMGGAFGGGCGCGGASSDLTPHDRFVQFWANLALCLAAGFASWYVLRRWVTKTRQKAG